jgi:hypothetical protein
VVTYLEIAAGHLGGLAALYAAGEVMFPLLPLARAAVVENSAHAIWVVGVPGNAEDRLARAYLEECTSSEYARMTAGRLGSKSDWIYVDAARRWTAVRAPAVAAFPGATHEGLGKGELAGQTLPSPQACVEGMYRLLNAYAGSTSGSGRPRARTTSCRAARAPRSTRPGNPVSLSTMATTSAPS